MTTRIDRPASDHGAKDGIQKPTFDIPDKPRCPYCPVRIGERLNKELGIWETCDWCNGRGFIENLDGQAEGGEAGHD